METTKTILSSQRFLDPATVAEKVAELTGCANLHLTAYIVEDDCEYAVLYDGHHRLAAARELGISITFDLIRHPEGLECDALMEACSYDAEFYDITTGLDYFTG